jgi:hypothetical protein
MKYTEKMLEEAWDRIGNLGPCSAEPFGVVWEECVTLRDAIKERDAKISDLEEGGRVLAAANKKHFESARANYEALEVAQKRLSAVELESKVARDLADFYRADAYNSDVEGMRREDRLKAMARYMPTEETRTKLMTICQDQGELSMGQRVDQVVESYEEFREEIARLRRDETDLRAELRTRKDRIQVLETEAANYRVKIGEMELCNPEVKVDESLVPAWVHEQIDKTRWSIIAHTQGTYRTNIGLANRLVHCIANNEFTEPKDRDECWRRVIESAFYWADQERPTRGGEEAAEFKAQIDRMVENGIKAAEDRINEVYAKQQEVVHDAFERGKAAGKKP